jgi:hypothetical protein
MYHQTTRRSDLPVAEGDLDLHLRRTVRRTSWMRQGFYVVVLLVALAGQVSGAVETLHIPLMAAIPAVAALELGGIVVLANADVRRRLGERAIASRLLSATIAAGAVAFNWLAHANRLMGGFFAGMSALGYLVWLMHTENQRRDRLRAKGDLPPTTPAYEVVGHWMTHPWLTRRARSLAKANPELGLYDSLAAARAEVRRRRQQAAISKVLHRKIRSAVDPTTADIAIAVYDLDEIANRLAARADYDGLTALIAADLAPARLAASLGALVGSDLPALAGPGPDAGVRSDDGPGPDAGVRSDDGPGADAGVRSDEPVSSEQSLPSDVRRELGALLPSRNGRMPAARSGGTSGRSTGTARSADPEQAGNQRDATGQAATERAGIERAGIERAGIARDVPLRRQVHDTLDTLLADGQVQDETELVSLVSDTLQLNDLQRLTIGTYVASWKKDVESGRRERASLAASPAT